MRKYGGVFVGACVLGAVCVVAQVVCAQVDEGSLRVAFVRGGKDARTAEEIRNNVRVEPLSDALSGASTTSQTVVDSLRSGIFSKLQKARKKANTDTAADFAALKKARKVRENTVQTLTARLVQKREQLNGTKAGERGEAQLHTDIASLERQIVDIAAAAKTDAAKLAAFNSKLKQRFDAAAALTTAEKSRVRYAEPDYLYAQDDAIPAFPNDPELPNQWYLGRILISQYPDMFESVSQIDHAILVAVIDSGVDYNNPDIKFNMWSSAVCADETGAPIDGGCVNGYDFVDNDPNPLPTDGSDHGTAVASLIAAETGNGAGMASLSHNRARVMALRVADSGYIQESNLIRAIYFAVYNNANIINLSLAGPTYSPALADALTFAQAHGVVVVTSAGNSGQNIDATPVYPAGYATTSPNIIPVAALSQDGVLASYSNYGANTVKVAAPGDFVWAASLNNTFTNHTGTSFSAPLITALIARNLSLNISATTTIETIPSAEGLSGVIAGGHALGFTVVGTSTPQSIETALFQDSTGGWVNPQSKGGEYVNPSTFVASSTYQLAGVPAVPTPLGPGSVTEPGSVVTNTTGQYFYWSASSGATNYGAYIRDLTTNTLIFNNDYLGNTTYGSIPTLTLGHAYRWNMRASNASGWSNYSSPLYFYVPNTVGTPTNLTPGGTSSPGPVLTTTSTTLSWGSVTNASQYKIRYTDLDTNQLTSGVTAGTSYTISSLVQGHRYVWDVQACISSTCGAVSSPSYFMIQSANRAPATPAMAGSMSVVANTSYSLTVTSSDLDNDSLQYTINWGDGNAISFGPYSPGVGATQTHVYANPGTYTITAQAYDGKVYGSSNTLVLTVTAAPAQTIDIVPLSVSLNTNSRVPGQSITPTLTIKNQGSASLSTPFTVSYYLASQASGLSTAYLLGTDTWSTTLAGGVQVAKSVSFTLPAYGDAVYSTAGIYSIIAVIDSANSVSESNKANNRPGQYGVDYAQFTVQTVDGGTGQSTLSFTLATTSPVVGASVPVTVTASGIPNGTKVNISTSLPNGSVSPNIITINNGTAQEPLIFTGAGLHNVTMSAAGITYTTPSVYVQPTSGSVPMAGSVTIHVVDATGKTALYRAVVKISCDTNVSAYCLGLSWTGMTDAYGNTTMPRGTLAQTPYFHVEVTYTPENGSAQTEAFTIAGTSADTYVTRDIKMPIDGTPNPIILLPGIMGSTSGKDVFATSAELPSIMPARAEFLHLLDAGHVVGWDAIEGTLERLGYQKGKSIIECPYDWRLQISYETSYLSRCIEKAQALNPGKKVDIIAHSQGGLVARAYVQQSTSNAEKVNKIAFVGTPQYGSTDAYYIWEGGDMDDAGSAIRPRSETVQNIYQAMEGKPLPVRVPSVLERVAMCVTQLDCSGIIPGATYEADPFVVKAFAQERVRSVRQLMPIYPFLSVNGGTPHGVSASNENEFLKALNGKPCQDGICDDSGIGHSGEYTFDSLSTVADSVKMAMFYDDIPTQDTKHVLETGYPDYPGLYEDGQPKVLNKVPGDGTVSAASIQSFLGDINNEILGTSKDILNGRTTGIIGASDTGHANLIGKLRKSIVSFITDVPELNLTSLTDITPTLHISASGPVQILVTDPSGHQKGLDSSGVAYDSIPGATAMIEGGDNTFSIPNPTYGNYTLSAYGTQAGTVSLTVGYDSGVEGATPITRQINVYYTAGEHTISLAVSADALTFISPPEAPVMLHAFPVSGNTRLTWLAASNTSPVSYKVYSRRSDEPHFYPIGTASAAQFDTTHAFAGVNDTITRLYEVSAVAANGTESALSDTVMDNDTDGDGITDAREADYTTSVTSADTDNDQLTDGQEAFIYHTNPLISDTDGDGVSDFDAVVHELRASLPPYALDDYATSTVASTTATAGDPVTISVLQNDIGNIATSSLTIATQPAHGVAALTTTASSSAMYGTLTYTPSTGFSGTDTFTYRIANQNGITSSARVSVFVPAVYTTPPPASGTTTTSTSTSPVTVDATSFIHTSGNTASVAHTVATGSASTTDRVLICGTSAQDAAGNNVPATSLTFGGIAFTKASTYLANRTANTTPTEFWHLVNPTPGSGTVTMTAPTTATESAIVCTSMTDLYWYVPGQPFTWTPTTGTTSPATQPAATSTTATSTPPTGTGQTSGASSTPITIDTTSFVRTSGSTASVAHTVAQGSATTTHRVLMCGTSAQDASGSNLAATAVTYGTSPLTRATSYNAAPTASTTPTELWYLEEAPVGINTVTATAPTAASWTSAVCTSFSDFYWYIPGRAFTW